MKKILRALLTRAGLPLVFFAFLSSFILYDPTPVTYLTYVTDPSSSITVLWHTDPGAKGMSVNYRKQGNETWQEEKGSFHKIPKYDVEVHRVDLIHLEPNTIYEFIIEGQSTINKFRTLPNDGEKPISFVVGGDAYRYYVPFKRMCKSVAQKNPDFVVVGGDLAYTNNNKTPFKGKNWEMKRWTTFLTEWKYTMVKEDGCMIPIIPVVGNHDVPKRMPNPKKESLLFYEIFAFPDPAISYRMIDIGKTLSLALLDTGHTYPIEDDQTKWLSDALKERESIPHKIAIYHVGAYPSVYAYSGRAPTLIRQNWCPLFEEYGIKLAFEHHSHAFKRSYPMKQEQISNDGVVYIGDGCWGVSPRSVRSNTPYLEKKGKKNCCSYVTIDHSDVTVETFNVKDGIFDVYTNRVAEAVAK